MFECVHVRVYLLYENLNRRVALGLEALQSF